MQPDKQPVRSDSNCRAPGVSLLARLILCVAASIAAATAIAQTTPPTVDSDAPPTRDALDLSPLNRATINDPAINDPTIKDRGSYQIEEHRVGNRLERLVIRRARGLTEIYENNRPGDLLSREDDELGQPQNLRRWTIGSW